MRIHTVTIKPSILVGAGISRSGGIHYERVHLEEQTQGTAETKRWETTRHVSNVDELRAAENMAGECRRALSKVCRRMAFGWVCAKEREAELNAVIEEVRDKVDQTNTTLKTCRLTAVFVKGQIASDDKEAAAAIQHELRVFMGQLHDALRSMDAKAIRQALVTGKGLDAILEGRQAGALQAAVKAARKAAKKISKEVEKKGRRIDEVRDELNLAPVDAARAMFLEVA